MIFPLTLNDRSIHLKFLPISQLYTSFIWASGIRSPILFSRGIKTCISTVFGWVKISLNQIPRFNILSEECCLPPRIAKHLSESSSSSCPFGSAENPRVLLVLEVAALSIRAMSFFKVRHALFGFIFIITGMMLS